MGKAIFVTPDILAEVEAAASARPQSEELSIGATEIVARIVDQWPKEPKPIITQRSAP
jgi:hypothetical protein